MAKKKPNPKVINAAFVMISILTLGVCLSYTIASIYLGPFPGIEFTTDWTISRILECQKGDAYCEADRNTLRVGDQITAIGNLSFKEHLADKNIIPFFGYRPGDIARISIIRAGEMLSVDWRMPIPLLSTILTTWAQTFIYIPFWLAGTIVLFLIQPHDRRWRLLILFNYITALYLAIGMALDVVPYTNLVVHSLTWLFVPVFLHLHLIVPGVPEKREYRNGLTVLYTAGILLSLLEILRILPDRAYFLGLMVAVLGSLGLLAYRLFTTLSMSDRLALRLMFVGIGMALSPGLILWVVPATMATVPQSTALVFSDLAIPLLPFFYLYAIYKRYLGGIEFRANRVLSLYSFILLYSLAIVLIFSFASQSLHLAGQSLIFSLAVTLIFVLAASPLRTRFQHWFDRMAYGARHDPQEIVRDFAMQLPAAADPDSLIRLITTDMEPSLMIRESALYVKTERGNELFYADGVPAADATVESAALESLNSDAGRYLPQGLAASGKFAWVRLAVLLETAGKPVGIWLFGRRDPDDFYPQADILLLQTLGHQVAPMLENIHLYEETRRQLERLQSLRDIDTTISSSLDLHFTLDVLLDQVTRRMYVSAADVLLLNPKTTILTLVASRGFRSDAMQQMRQRLGEGYAGQAAHERRLIFIQNLKEESGGFLRSSALSTEQFVSYCAAPLISKGQVKGVLEVFFRTSLPADADWFDFLESLTVQAAIAIDNASLYNDLERTNAELVIAYDSTIEGWSRALDLRDEGEAGHTRRVAEWAERLARAMGIYDENELSHLRRGAMLHDLGKMGIPDSILLKTDKLNESEWTVMRRHPLVAYDILSSISYLKNALDIPHYHHERWDGTGYPRGLKGDQIPLAARIFAVVDVWDALTSDRPFRRAWTRERALQYIREESGKHFDPSVVAEFLRMVRGSEPADNGTSPSQE
jgi:HD-GYP domain-containing protein (c-di-GMP phosphodiesterase class II)